MIDAEQAAYLRERVWSSDQDYFYWSCLRGEPFLQGDVLHFFDGHTLSVVGFAIDSGLSDAAMGEQLDSVLCRWLATERVNFINYCGPAEPRFRERLGKSWSVVWELEPDSYNVDSWIDYADRAVLATRQAREAIRTIRAKHLRVSIEAPLVLGWEHIALLQAHSLRIGDDISDLAMVLAGLTILRSPATVLAEVRSEERLGGFALTHEFFDGKPFLIVACFDRSCAGASDAVYATLIRHYQLRGASRFNLGYTIDQGLLRYKAKWGAVRTGSPFVQVIWKRDHSECEFEGCLHWACRFMRPGSAMKVTAA